MSTLRLSSLHALGAVWALVTIVSPARADPQMDALIDALRVPDTVAIMREEGLEYASDLGAEMLSGTTGSGWDSAVSRIYDTSKMQALVVDGFRSALEGKDVSVISAFFATELGREVISLELAARQAFMDEAAEEAAKDAYVMAGQDKDWLHARVGELIADSDLIEFNVMGALNSNLMFYRGLADGGAIEMSEGDMLADVWAQEDAIREDSAEWLGAYLMLAYRSLDEKELETYAELYRTPEGRQFNAAIFEAYDQMYEELSYLLGQAVAQQMQSEEL